MTDVNTIARRYIDLWNERTPGRRRRRADRRGAATLSGFPLSPDRRAQRLRRPRPLLLGAWPGRRRQPDQGHRFRRRQRRTYPEHHRISRSDPARRVTDANAIAPVIRGSRAFRRTENLHGRMRLTNWERAPPRADAGHRDQPR
jgi:hypothetical protein